MAEFDEHATIADAIDAVARGVVKKTKEGDREVEYMSIKDLMEADALRSGKAAAAKTHMGLRFTKMIPPGAG